MEDNIVKPGLYAYSFRVDLPHDKITKVLEFIKRYETQYYIVGQETSDLGKPHFQCILWYDKKINQSKLRNWWKGKTLETKQPCSLVTAKKIKNLAKYTMKDENFITNLSEEEINKIGKWNKKLEAVEWSIELDKYAEYIRDVTDGYDCKVPVGWDTYTTSPEPRMIEFMSCMLDFYKVHSKRPNRNTLQYLAWKYGIISNDFIISKWF